MNALRKISIDTVLLALAVALCLAGLVWLGGAHAWIAVIGVGVFVAQGAPPACPTCSGDGTIESDEPFMMMSALPCPACSPLTVGVVAIGVDLALGRDKGVKVEQWEALMATALGDRIGYDAEHAAECTDLSCCFPPPRELAALYFFARLMAFVAAQEAPQTTKRPRSCATCSRPLDAWQLRFDGGAELRCGRSDCAAKDKLVARREVQADGTVRETAANHARAPIDLAALRTLARAASERASIPGSTGRRPLNQEAFWKLIDEDYAWCKAQPHTLERDHVIAVLQWSKGALYAKERSDVTALASAVEQLADALEAKAQPRAHLDADELAIIEQTRALVRERADLRASVDLLDEQGRRMKAERDEERADNERLRGAAANYEELLDVLGAIYGVDAAPGEVEQAARRSRDAFEATEAEIERMKPVVEAARAAEKHITDLEDSSPINSGVLIDLRAALETLAGGAS